MRGDRARSLFSKVARHLTCDLETVTVSGISISVLSDPEERVWAETGGGGREIVRAPVFTLGAPGQIPAGAVVTWDDKRWVCADVERERLYGLVMGDRCILERLFGEAAP